MSPEKFVKPADLFKNRRKSIIEPQSPMKCLSNLTEPSPTKKLPTLLRNPFNQPVKRRLNLGSSPNKSSSRQSSPRKSPNKRTRLMQMDEDANLEAPPSKRHNHNLGSSCYSNDWKLRTKLRVNFMEHCKNWLNESSSTHKRHLEDSLNDKTISIEAIKNAATVYQQPHLAWLPLYPRRCSDQDKTKKKDDFKFTRNSPAISMMHKNWCESLDDLVNLVIDSQCKFFYLCSDHYNILFKKADSKTRQVEAFVSPISYGMSCELKKLGIQLNCDEDSGIENDCSLDDNDVEDNDEASQFLESLGLSQEIHFESKRKGFLEADSNSQSTKSVSNKPLATIEGAEDVRKLVKFLQGNRTYTISTMGEFAFIPPTLLAPSEFRLSTALYPDVTTSKTKDDTSNSKSFIEVRGTILPNLYERLHKLLTISDNLEHSCSSTILEISAPLEAIQFT